MAQDDTMAADALAEAVQPAGKTAGLGAGTRERIERTVAGYERVNEETVTFEQFLRDLRFEGFVAEVACAVADNIFWNENIHVYPPYEVVDETAEQILIGEETWTADRESWTATRWTNPNRELDLNTTQLHDDIRSGVRDGERVVVKSSGETLYERETPLRKSQ